MPASPSPVTICTLWEKDFHKGVGALVNSLARAGYRGKVWAGYRGALPDWASRGVNDGELHVVNAGEAIQVLFVKLETDTHFTQYKAVFMTRVMTQLAPEAEGIFYLDPDVMLMAPWTFFERWIGLGIAACEDGSYPLNATHPLVREWQQYTETLGYKRWSYCGASLNGGLVGVSRSCLPFLTLWGTLLHAITRDFGIGGYLKSNSRSELFYATDQDALTVAASLTEYPVSWVGPDGMGFGRGEWLTIHAYSPKPWRRRVLRDLLVEGHKPDSALRLYWSLAGSPIQIEPPSRIRSHRWLIPLAAMLSRVYRRGS